MTFDALLAKMRLYERLESRQVLSKPRLNQLSKLLTDIASVENPLTSLWLTSECRRIDSILPGMSKRQVEAVRSAMDAV